MNKFVSILCLTILCTACVTQEDNFQSKEMNYVCSSLTKNYLRISQFDYYEVWNKAKNIPDTILFLYAKPQTNGQIAFNPNTRLLECKKEKYKYILSEIDQHSLKTRPILILRLPI